MKKPVLLLVGFKLNGNCLHWFNIKRMFQGRIVSLAVDEAKEMAVQMQWVPHHSIVGQHKSYPFTFMYNDFIGNR